MAASSSYTRNQMDILRRYTACDISDALLKLKVPGAGFVSDLNMYAPSDAVTVAPASTVLFAPKGSSPKSRPPSYPEPNIPAASHWADLTQPGTIVVIRQPDGHRNAVCGGIMALRISQCHAKGIVVWGRARDISELKSTGLPIWASGLSTVGAGASCTPWAVQVPITVDGDLLVEPGDLVFSDPINGVVVIPRAKVAQAIDILPKLTTADERVRDDVLGGTTVREAFKKHRGNL
ncbi:dlpA [Zalerion maritima]|uniref:DlpA n=1 Tax=Zalerion maritima TaxID=339359 RepID=A0AAD5RHH2_9PEZI|nr:dlpA [Zalerion maritima]